MKPGRNDLCACGSGLKYKQCCEGRTVETHWWKYAAAGLGALLLAVGFVTALMDWASREPGPPGPAPSGKVWSEEHGHWHDAAPGAGGGTPGAQAPPGPAPPGKVWSVDHGHWHDAAPGASGDAPAAQPPPGPAPPGKVWSAEHGHWHDAEGTGGPPRLYKEDAPPLDGTETSPSLPDDATLDPNE